MGYNRANYLRIRNDYETRALRAQEAAEQRALELRAAVPGVAEIDRRLAETGPAILAAAAGGKEGLDERIAAIRKDMDALRAKRAELLRTAGYAPDYDAVRYACPVCSDSGFVGNEICTCMKRELTLAGYESSGIGTLIEKQTFENFSLDYYNETDRPKMMMVAERLRRYAQDFEPGRSESLLLIGKTGLGKTHLSTAIAGTVIDRGYDVVYVTAQNLFADFETVQFRSHMVEPEDYPDTARYSDCDLLIIDDLGTEVTNTFTIACLYNIVNSRHNKGLPIIINTNLDQNDLRNRYADRITSRLFGDFYPFLFVGGDIRKEKLERGNH